MKCFLQSLEYENLSVFIKPEKDTLVTTVISTSNNAQQTAKWWKGSLSTATQQECQPWHWCLHKVSRRENSIDLLLGTASTADYASVSVEICSSVASVVSRPLAAGQQQFYTHRRFITTVVTAAVIDKRHRSAYLSLVKVPAHYSDPSSAALTEGFIADCVQTSSPRVQVYRCLHGSAPAYLTDELCRVADVEAHQRLRFSSSSTLIISHTRLPTIGDRAFALAAARVWNSLTDPATSAPSVAVCRSRLKTHMFNISYTTFCDCTRVRRLAWPLGLRGHESVYMTNDDHRPAPT